MLRQNLAGLVWGMIEQRAGAALKPTLWRWVVPAVVKPIDELLARCGELGNDASHL